MSDGTIKLSTYDDKQKAAPRQFILFHGRIDGGDPAKGGDSDARLLYNAQNESATPQDFQRFNEASLAISACIEAAKVAPDKESFIKNPIQDSASGYVVSVDKSKQDDGTINVGFVAALKDEPQNKVAVLSVRGAKDLNAALDEAEKINKVAVTALIPVVHAQQAALGNEARAEEAKEKSDNRERNDVSQKKTMVFAYEVVPDKKGDLSVSVSEMTSSETKEKTEKQGLFGKITETPAIGGSVKNSLQDKLYNAVETKGESERFVDEGNKATLRAEDISSARNGGAVSNAFAERNSDEQIVIASADDDTTVGGVDIRSIFDKPARAIDSSDIPSFDDDDEPVRSLFDED